MESELLNKVQNALYEILLEFDRVCEQLQLPYFLSNGTLLGAIRHNGFIPWDDDVDVGMLREDYEKFLMQAPQVLDKAYFLQDWKSDASYGNTFAKLRKNGTVYIERGARRVDTHCGIFIDIFPYDVAPDSEELRKKQGKSYDFLRRCVLVKCGYRPWDMHAGPVKALAKRVGYLPILCYAAVHSKEAMIASYEKACTAYNGKAGQAIFENAGAYNYGRMMFPAACFQGKRTHLFRDREFPVPADAEGYLTKAYGDYLTLPPVEKRENHHDLVDVKL